ncbi:MAG: phosphate acyltransferase PlsX [Melioribacteraceae bacterium]|nr:phosphate acyltransferase PlsX [Melioribacteraceae bacterium]
MTHKAYSNCRIAVDAMGGDYAPHNVIKGAIDAIKMDPSIELYFVGQEEAILKELNKIEPQFNKENIIHASEVIDMCDNPTIAVRKTKTDSSIVVGVNMVRDKKADAFISAGNTGAVMTASTLNIGRIKGVGRPTIGAQFPSTKGGCFVYDVGASVDSKPQHILEYAIMGSIFVKEIMGIENPTVGLLSVGEEDSKGNDTTLKALQLLKEADINFIGNVEGRDILTGKADIVVCDGFVGNIMLKFAESVLTLLKIKIRDFADGGLLNKIKVLLMKGTLKRILKDFDSDAHGGVPLMGVKGISIIGHGSSSPLGIRNMILRAKEMHEKELIKKIEESLGKDEKK